MPGFEELFKHVADSEFLTGANERSWKASFDWLMKPDNFAKVMEGNYSTRQTPQPPPPQFQPRQQSRNGADTSAILNRIIAGTEGNGNEYE
jgi:hypothetical protein